MNRKVFSKLPDVFKTEVQRKFFDATVEKVFSKKEIEKINGFVGRRESGDFDPLNDFYKPEVNKNRTRYQLEPVVNARGPLGDSYSFYYDFINYLRVNNSDLDENLSFESEYASFCPPINVDMFINYQNYYWVPETPESIKLTGMNDTQVEAIFGNQNYSRVISSGGTSHQVDFKNGIIVSFPNSVNYRDDYFVEGVGIAINLVRVEDVIPTGVSDPIDLPDYVTIARGSTDGNHWSRTNRWIHVTSIESNNLINGTPFQESSIRATKPIIEFNNSMELYAHGREFIGDFNFIIRNVDDFQNTYSGIMDEYGYSVSQGDTIVSIDDMTIYEVTGSGANLLLSSSLTLSNNDSFMVKEVWNGSFNTYFHVRNNAIEENTHQKSGRNVPPRFHLYDVDGVSLSDQEKYPLSTFDGNEVFMFTIGEDSQHRVDRDTGFRLVYGSLEQISEINFDNRLLTERYSYVVDGRPREINGHYFYNDIGSGKMNSWHESNQFTKQKSVSKFVAMGPEDTAYELDVEPRSGSDSISVTVGTNDNVEFDYVQHNGRDWINVHGIRLAENTDVTVFVDTDDKVYETDSYMEVPSQLSKNPLQDDVYVITYGEITPHLISIIRNNIDGDNPRLRDNGYNESNRDLSLGELILKVKDASPLAQLLSTESINILESIKSSMIDYENFKSKLIRYATRVDVEATPRESIALNYILSDIISDANASSEFLDSYTNSMMCPIGSPTVESELMIGQEFRSVTTNGSELDFGFDLRSVSVSVYDHNGNQVSHTIDGDSVYFQNDDENDFEVTIEFLGVQTSETDQFDILSNEVNHVITKVSDYHIDGYKNQSVLTYGKHYIIGDVGGDETIIFDNSLDSGDTVLIAIFDSTAMNSLIPATPSKLGMLGSYEPTIELDVSYVTPRYVMVGHDGSKTPVYGEYSSVDVDDINSGNGKVYDLLRRFDIRDVILLHYERLVYNQIAKNYNSKVNPMGDISKSLLNDNGYNFNHLFSVLSEECLLWLTESQLEYESNDSYDPSDWKTWNYTLGDTQGSWRSVYLSYFGTIEPNTKPWQMLGFTQKPSWWSNTHDSGDGFSGYGSDYSDSNSTMWADIEHGIIRRGKFKGVSGLKYGGICGSSAISSLDPSENGVMDAYIGVIPSDNRIPVSSGNELKTIVEIFGTSVLHDGGRWNLSDIPPTVYAWMTTSAHRYAVAMANYVMRPYEFATKFSDVDSIMAYGSQVIDRRTSFTVDYSNFSYHSKEHYVRGWSQFIFDFMSKSSVDTELYMEDVLKSVSVNLGNKIGGYTDPISMKMYLDRLTVGGDSGSLLIPSEDYRVSVHTGAPFRVATMSGVIVSITNNGYKVYGYDVKDPTFNYYPKSSTSPYNRITMGGEPYSFVEYDYDVTYTTGTIVRKNETFYRAIKNTTSGLFDSGEWDILNELPVNGGISSKVYTNRSENVSTISYGHEFSNVEQLVDFIIGYGEYLSEMGWSFDSVSETGEVDDWYKSVRTLLFWLSTNWDSGNALALCPSAENIKLSFDYGVPDPILTSRNGAYNVTDKYGYPVSYRDLTINRNVPDGYIEVKPNTYGDGIFFMRMHLSETEHVIVVDNSTSFGDVIYSGLLGTRQDRLRVAMDRTLNWSGEYSANGYVISNGELKPNFDTLSDLGRDIHTSAVYNPSVRDAANHMIGFERKQYMDDLNVSDEAQYDFYKGFLTGKGSTSSVWAILKSSSVFSSESITFNEEWALKKSNFGSVDNETKISISTSPLEVTLNPQSYTMDLRDPTGYYVSSVSFLSKGAVYSNAPEVTVNSARPPSRPASLEAVMNRDRTIDHIRVLDTGAGYGEDIRIYISNDNIIAGDTDIVYPLIGREYESRDIASSIYVNKNDQQKWIYSNKRNGISQSIPKLDSSSLVMPYAGYVKVDEVDHMAYNLIDDLLSEKADILRSGDSIWVASNIYSDWGVYEVLPHEFLVNNGKISLNFISDRNFNFMKSIFGVYRFVNQSGRYVISEGPVLLDLGDDLSLHYIKLDIASGDYTLLNSEMEEVDEDLMDELKELHVFRSRRFMDLSTVPPSISDGTIWIDSYDGDWAVGNRESSSFIVDRQPSDYIDGFKFDRLRINEDDRTLSDLQVNDPIKGIFLSEIESSVDIKSFSDPATYTRDDRTLTMDSSDVGKVWMDLSSFKYIMYEQPVSNSTNIEKTIDYRRKYWGRVFPNSPVTCYEWVESYDIPVNYDGDGFPMDTENYIERTTYNKSSRVFETKYYFWVTGKDSREDSSKLSTNAIQSFIRSNSSNGNSWYAPVYSDDDSFSIVISNETDTLVNTNGLIDISFVTEDRMGGSHEQWKLVRDNDRFIDIPNIYWDKILTSVIGMSKPLDASLYPRGVPIGGGEIVLPVPDPLLSEADRYGMDIRPQKTIFSDQSMARKEFIGAINQSLSNVKIWQDAYSGWDDRISDKSIYQYDDWYESGFESVRPNRTVEYYDDLINLSETTNISNGMVFRVLPFNPLPNDRFELYEYIDGQFRLVGRQNGKLTVIEGMISDESSLSSRLALFDLFDAIRFNLLVGDDTVLLNNIFFVMLNYSLSESRYNDWAFKTSFISFMQDDLRLEQRSSFSPNNIDSFISYVEDTKPYHTKIRDIITTYRYDEVAYGSLDDWHNMKIKMQFSRHQNNSLVMYSKDINGRFDPIERPLDTSPFDESDPDYIHSNVIAPSDEMTLDANAKSGSELVSLDINETLIIDVVEDDIVIINDGLWDGQWGWDAEYPEVNLSWDSDVESDLNNTMTAEYRLFYSAYTNKFGRAHEMVDEGVEIVGDIPYGVVSAIEISSDTNLERNGNNIVWIDNEQFQYREVVNRDGRIFLQSIRRSMNGTPMQEHPSGTRVYRADKFMNDNDYLMSVNGVYGAEYNIDFDVVQPQYRVINVGDFTNGIPAMDGGEVSKVQSRTPLINPWFVRLDMETDPFSEYNLSGYRKAVFSKASLELLRWIRR